MIENGNYPYGGITEFVDRAVKYLIATEVQEQELRQHAHTLECNLPELRDKIIEYMSKNNLIQIPEQEILDVINLEIGYNDNRTAKSRLRKLMLKGMCKPKPVVIRTFIKWLFRKRLIRLLETYARWLF